MPSFKPSSANSFGSKGDDVQTRKRSSHVFMKSKSSQEASTSKIPNKRDPTLSRNSSKSESEIIHGVYVDSVSVEDEYFQREKQAQLRNAVRDVHSNSRSDPLFNDNPFSPPSGRMLQPGPFAYATGLEPVQEFLGNLSINSESSLLSSYNSFDDRANKLLA